MGLKRGRLTRAVVSAVAVALVVAVFPMSATAGGNQGGGGSGSSSCDLYPLGADAALLTPSRVGKVVDDLMAGTPSGHEGWLTWTGDVSDPALAKSLTPPGDAKRYVNPDDPADHVLSVGDPVASRPGSTTSAPVHIALDKLLRKRIVVPVRDSFRFVGRNLRYHVSGFADVEITSYRLGSDTRVSAKYLGPSSCAATEAPPVAKAASASTAEDEAATITLTGTSSGSATSLTFAPGSPSHGTVTLTGAPSCRRDGAGLLTCTIAAAYAPAADFFGSDGFSFTVSDGRGAARAGSCRAG
jgi:Bacterial Ig domain